jgi:hypothetical protein
MLRNSVNRSARTLLGLIRIVNGAVGLFVPKMFIARFDPDHQPSPAAIYAFRLFGVRTLLIGVDLLRDGPHLPRTVAAAPLIHGSDVATVVALGAQGVIPPRTARVTTAISSVNLLLALVAAMSSRRAG